MAYFGISWGLYFSFVHVGAWEWLAIILVLVIETGWQLIQAYVISPVPYSYDGTIEAFIGGAGFNFIQMIYATGGLIGAFLVDLMQAPLVRPLGGYEIDPCAKWDYNDEDYNEC